MLLYRLDTTSACGVGSIMKTRSSFIRLVSYVKPYWNQLIWASIAASLFGLVSAAPIFLLQYTVDELFVRRMTHLIVPFASLFLTTFILKGLFMYWASYTINWVSSHIINDIRKEFLSKIIYFPLNFFKNNSTGKLISLFLNDMTMLHLVAANTIKNGLKSIFEALFLFGVAFYQNWWLTFLTLLLSPLIVWSVRRIGKSVKKSSHNAQEAVSDISRTLQDLFGGIREVKVYHGEEKGLTVFANKQQDYFKKHMRNVHLESLGPAWIEGSAMLGCSIVFYIAAHQVLNNSITPGQLVSFLGSMVLAYQPVKRLVGIYGEIQTALAAAERVFSVTDMPTTTNQLPACLYQGFNTALELKNVSFGYMPNNLVLEELSLHIPKGKKIGIMGLSGAGKSTLCDLLLGFLQPSRGKILIDGTEHKILRDALTISYVSQHSFLFDATIRENIAYSVAHATHADIVEASQQALIHDFIEKLPQKYETQVGENGAFLSGGQKQRIALARALLRKPELLILDEATSALDVTTEQLITQAIKDLSLNCTVIAISHRPTLMQAMDQVFVLEHKKLHQSVATFETLKNQNAPDL